MAVSGQTVQLKYGYPTKGSVNKVYTLADPGQGDFSWVTGYGGWNLGGNDAVVNSYSSNGGTINGCWFGYREATVGAAAAVSAIDTTNDCVNAVHGYGPPNFYGTYAAD